MTPEEIILTVNPIFKGSIETEYGNILFGRMWHSWESKIIEKLCINKNIDIIFNVLENSHGNINNSIEIHSPIEDFSVPSNIESFKVLLKQVIDQLKNNKIIFIHCYGGIGRTSIAIACILIGIGYSNQDALKIVQDKISGPETQKQIEFIKNFEY